MKENSADSDKDAELVNFMREFSVSVLIWGSDDVLREWTRFMATMRDFGAKDKNSTSLLINAIMPTGALLLALRRDIGHDNKNLTSLGLMNLFITDLKDEIDKAIASSSTTAARPQEN